MTPSRARGAPRPSEPPAPGAHRPPAPLVVRAPGGLVWDPRWNSWATREGQARAEPLSAALASSPPAQPGQPESWSGGFPKVLSTIPGLFAAFLHRSLPPLNFSHFCFPFLLPPRPPIPSSLASDPAQSPLKAVLPTGRWAGPHKGRGGRHGLGGSGKGHSPREGKEVVTSA